MISSVLVALLTLAIIIAVVLSMSERRRVGSAIEHLPRELRKSRLQYAEQLFTTTGRLPISARVDRAYRVPSGMIVLLELKTREIDRPYLSDVIELSTQRAAIALQTGETVADHAYVAVRRSDSAAPRIHRVRLMSIAKVKALALRREAILLGRLAPSYAGSTEICRQCAFASGCEKFKDGWLRMHET